MCFCLLGSIMLSAQPQNSVERLLTGIRKITALINKDSSIPASCKKEVKAFAKTIPAKSGTSLTKDAIQKLFTSTDIFTGSVNDLSAERCYTRQMNDLLDSATQLLLELGKLKTDTGVVKLKLTGNGTNGWQFEADSLSKNIRQLVIKDSMGHLLARLYPDTKTIKLVTEKINMDDSSYKVTQLNNQSVSVELPAKSSITKTENTKPLQNNIEQQLAKLRGQNTVLLISMALLFIFILATVLFYATAFKRLGLSLKQQTGLLNPLKTMSPMEEIKSDITSVPPVNIPDTLRAIEPTPLRENPKIPESNTAETSGIICEIMMTAGPRKKPMSDPDSDKDLGEDVCGFISTGNEIYVWLLDGTSDDDSWKDPVSKQEYFSSRLLAQSIGYRLRSDFIANGPRSLVTVFEEIIIDLKQHWLQVIEQLPETERMRLINRIESKISPQCSTTALVGHLQSNGDFSACRTGDSQMYLFEGPADKLNLLETPLMGKSENGVDRIFFRLQLDEDHRFEIVSNKPVFDVTMEKNVQRVICFSDGIGAATEILLKEQFKNDPAGTKHEIIYHLQGTGDDKAICFIERR